MRGGSCSCCEPEEGGVKSPGPIEGRPCLRAAGLLDVLPCRVENTSSLRIFKLFILCNQKKRCPRKVMRFVEEQIVVNSRGCYYGRLGACSVHVFESKSNRTREPPIEPVQLIDAGFVALS